MTAAQLAAAKEAAERAQEDKAAAARKAAKKEVDERAYDALVSVRNANRAEDTLDASGMDQALAALDSISLDDGSAASAGDKHPEKRMRAAWAAYEAAELPALQAEKPNLKRTQYRDMLWKVRPICSHLRCFARRLPPADALRACVSCAQSWQKSPANPLNAARASAGGGGGGGDDSGSDDA